MSQTSEARDISAEMAGIHAVAYERECEPVKTILDGDLAICLLELELSRAEAVLVAHGHHDSVREQRHALEHALAPALSAAVERATGRTVTNFLTATELDPSLTLLTFRFGPPRRRPTT